MVQYSPCYLGVKYSWIEKVSGQRKKSVLSAVEGLYEGDTSAYKPGDEHKQKQ